MTTTTKTVAATEDRASAERRLRKELAEAEAALGAARAKATAAGRADEAAKIRARVARNSSNTEAADDAGTALLVALDGLADAEEEVDILQKSLAAITTDAERSAVTSRHTAHEAAKLLLRERLPGLKERLHAVALDLVVLSRVEGRRDDLMGHLLGRHLDRKRLAAEVDARIAQLAAEAHRS